MNNTPCHQRAAEAYFNQCRIVHSSFLNLVENAINVWKAVLKQQLEEIRDQIA